MTHLAHKLAVKAFADNSLSDRSAADVLFAAHARISVCHPFNDMAGVGDYMTRFIGGLATAFKHLQRRDDILIGGHFEGGDWVSTHGHYLGHFTHDWLGIPATDTMQSLRFGEFYRFEAGKVVELIVYLDIPALMIAADCWPINTSPGMSRGYTGTLPGPATRDGLCLTDNAAASQRSFQIVSDMLQGLATKDEAWRPYWHNDMCWHGPAAFGAFVGIENFAGFQTPFEGAFSLWSGGSSGNGVTKHFARFGDGNYACLGGWPSLMCIQEDTFLDQPSKGETVFMRVCDWWRREGDLLMENWVIVDIPDVLLQLGVDLFPDHHDVAAGPRKF